MEKVHDAAKAKEWLSHAERWRASGLSLNAYCAQNGLKYTTLKYWCYRSSSAAQRDVSGAGDLRIVPVQVSSSTDARSQFDSHAIVIMHERGWRAVLPARLGADFVAEVLRGVTA